MRFIDEDEYINYVSQRVRNYSLKGRVHNFACPICGDSQTKKYKARGNIYPKGDSYSYKCFNCSWAGSFGYFLKTAFPDLFEEYRKDIASTKLLKKKEIPKSITNRKQRFKELEKFQIDCPKISELPSEHSARIYMESRRLSLDLFYYADCWKTFIKQYDEEKAEKAALGRPCIIIPCIDQDQKLLGFQGRNLNPKAVKRYETFQASKDFPVVYGLDRVNFKKPIYITEGPFDSTFLKNAISVLSSSFIGKIQHLNLKDPIFVYDNENRNKEIVKIIEDSIDEGYKVVIYPREIQEKDLNDIFLAGINVRQLVKDNTFQGLQAKLKFKGWKV